MSVRPDLVECWVFRVPADRSEPEVLLLRRAPGRIFAGLWQCVTGGIEPGERVPRAALREVEEETGLSGDEIDAIYDLDQTAWFYDEGADALVSSSVFAVRVRPDAVPRPSHEHDDARWVAAAEAPRIAVWPAYEESIRRIVERLLDPDLARWFELSRDGRRLAR